MYNGNWVVTNNLDDLSGGTPVYKFSVNMGVGTSEPTAYGTGYAYREGFAANAGTITKDDESLNGRMVPTYAGITTVISADIINSTTTSITVAGLSLIHI